MPRSLLWQISLKLYFSLTLPVKFMGQWNRSGRFRNLKAFRGAFQGRRVLVLGNGPSRDKIPQDAIKAFRAEGGVILAVNWWWSDSSEWCPDVVVVSDPDTMNAPQWEELLRRLTPETILAVPADKFFLPLVKDLQATYVVPFCSLTRRIRLTWKTSIRPDRVADYAGMTLYRALALALWASPSKIFVLGMDNSLLQSMTVDCDNILRVSFAHHTGSAYQDDTPVELGLYKSVSDFLFDQQDVFRLDAFADARILNLDPNSLTDSFAKSRTWEDSIRLLRAVDPT